MRCLNHIARDIHWYLQNFLNNYTNLLSSNMIHFTRNLSVITDIFNSNIQNEMLYKYSTLDIVLQTTATMYNSVKDNMIEHQYVQNIPSAQQKLRNSTIFISNIQSLQYAHQIMCVETFCASQQLKKIN